MASGNTPDLPSSTRTLLDQLLTEFSRHQHQPSRLLAQRSLGGGARQSLFYCLGYLAKADGRVTESDIRYAENLMTGLTLSPRHRRQAIRRFHQGRDAGELSTLKLARFRLARPWRRQTGLIIGLCLCHGAQLQGRPGRPRRYRCEDAFDRLGLPVAAIDHIYRHYQNEIWVSSPPPKPETLKDAHRILGVRDGESFQEIKRRYRRSVARYHPDKLGDSLPPAEQARARDQLLRLQQAWEVVKRRERLSR